MSNLSTEKLEIKKSVLIQNYCDQIDQKMNALKIEYLKEWEKNHNFDSSSIDNNLKSLQMEKERLSRILNNTSNEIVSLNVEQLVEAV